MAKKKSVQEARNVVEYLEWVKNIQKGKQHADVVFYRGMANSKWDIIPSLFRYQTEKTEKELLQSATNLIWNELKDTTTYLEKLIILQHYGFPTRLLDVTTNPLVALYFACWKEEQKDGSVYVGFTDNLDNNASIERICNLLFEENLKKDGIDFMINAWTPGKLLRIYNHTKIKKIQNQFKKLCSLLPNFTFQLLEKQKQSISDELRRWIEQSKSPDEQIFRYITSIDVFIENFNSILAHTKAQIQNNLQNALSYIERKDFDNFDNTLSEILRLFREILDMSFFYSGILIEHEKDLFLRTTDLLHEEIAVFLENNRLGEIMLILQWWISNEEFSQPNSQILVGDFDLTRIDDILILMQSHFILPPYNNDRIIAQSGAFIIPKYLALDCPKVSEAINTYVNCQPYTGSIDYKEAIRDNEGTHFAKKIIIPSKNKKSILKDLEIYGIHEGSLFPDTEHKLKYLADSNSIKK